MTGEPTQPPPLPPPEKKKSPALALTLAFLPSVMVLGTLTWLRSGNGNLPAFPLALECILSMVCCLASASMLFQRKTALTICAGILFLILNATISSLFGCGVVLSGLNFN
jgi:hypothetical protein